MAGVPTVLPLKDRAAADTIAAVETPTDYLALSDEDLLDQCDVHLYKASGPGGQHRNKVSSAVRLKHRPTAVTAHSDESRSQHDNRRKAFSRLRMKLACDVRRGLEIVDGATAIPEVVASCMFTPRGRGPAARRKLGVGPRDRRFWPVAAFLLDLLETLEGKLSPAARCLGISTANFAAVLKSNRHLLTAAQRIRQKHGCGRIT